MIATAEAPRQRGPETASKPPGSVRLVSVPEERAGQRLDNFLFGLFKGVPKSHVYRLLRTRQVRINGKRAKADARVAAGDEVRLPPVRMADPQAPVRASERSLASLDSCIVFEDRNFIAIDKPSGLASHGGSGIALGAIEQIRQLRPNEHLELVHRLDRDTSGVLLFSRRRSALTGLQAAIREGRVTKRYLALLVGTMPEDRIVVDQPLRKSVLQGGERLVRIDPEGKDSRSTFRVLQRFAAATLVEVMLDTGRTHQIRVHAAYLGCPVAGDEKYGDADANRKFKDSGLKRLFLHAAEFAFELGEARYDISAPLPAELAAVQDRLA